jgi:hypothetical protein
MDIIKTRYSKKYTENFDNIFRQKSKDKKENVKSEEQKKLVVSYPKIEPKI